MENRPRSIAVGSSYLGCPQLRVRGMWVYEFGFDIGDQTEITNPEPGTMIIQVKTPAAVMNRFRFKRQLEIRLLELRASTTLTQAQLEKLKSLEEGLRAA